MIFIIYFIPPALRKKYNVRLAKKIDKIDHLTFHDIIFKQPQYSHDRFNSVPRCVSPWAAEDP